MKNKLLAVLVIMICGCSVTSTSDLWHKDIVFQNITVKHDSFRNETSYTTPSLKIENMLINKTWFLRTYKHQESALFTQVYVTISYLDDAWRYLGNATSNGESFPTRSIRQDVTSCNSAMLCNYQEDIIITVSLDKLKSLMNENGVVLFTIKDRFGESLVVDFTSKYVAALAAKLGV